MDRFTDALDGLAFGAIGVAVLAVGFGALGSQAEAPRALPAPAAIPVAAAVYDIDLDAATWSLPADDAADVADVADVADAADVPEAPRPEAPAPVSAAAVTEDAPRAIPARRAPRTRDGGAVRAGVAAAAPKAKRGRRCEEPRDPLIAPEGAGFTVGEDVVRRYTRDWSRLGDLGWSEVHHGKDGKADGMRIGGIRCGSDPWDAGFRSGDVIHTVNGRRVHSVPHVIGAYLALKGKREFTVELTRNGERRTVRYRLV